MTTVLTHRHPKTLWNDPFFDKLWGQHFSNQKTSRSFLPRLDIVSSDNDYRIAIDLPGIAKDDIEITVHENTLTLSGKRHAAELQKSESYKILERSHGDFSRSIQLPKDCELDTVSAEMKNGVLRLTISKKEEVKPRRIELN